MNRLLSIALVLTLAICFVATGCRPSADRRRLEIADGRIADAPYTAKLQLDSVDTGALSAEDRALYDLLSIEAKYSIDYDLPDTSKIAKVRNFFSVHPESNYRIRANYYYAVAQYLDSCIEDAVAPAAEVFLEARDRDERLWLARSSQLLSSLLSLSQHPEKSLKFDSIASLNFKQTDRKWDYFLSKLMMAKNLTSIYQSREADSLLIETKKEIDKELPTERTLIVNLLLARLRIKIQENDYNDVQSISQDLNEIKRNYKLKSSDFSYLALIEIESGRYENALKYIDSASNNIETYYDRNMLEKARLEYAGSVNDIEMKSVSAIQLLDMMKGYDREVSNSHVADKLDAIFEKDKMERDLKRRDVLRAIVYIAISILVVAFVLIFILRRFYNKKSRELVLKQQQLASTKEKVLKNEDEISRIKDELQNVKNALDKTDGLNVELKETISEVYRQDMPVLSKLYDSFSDFGGAKANDLYRSDRLKTELSSFFAEKDLDWFVSVADLANNGLVTELKRDIPGIKKTYLELFALYLSGFTTKGISVMLGVNRNAVDQRKSRLKILIESSEDSVDKEKYLGVLTAANRH